MPLAQKAKRAYQNGPSYKEELSKSKKTRKVTIEENYIYSESDKFIGYLELTLDSNGHEIMPPKIKINNHWYELTKKVKWDD